MNDLLALLVLVFGTVAFCWWARLVLLVVVWMMAFAAPVRSNKETEDA